MREDRINQAVWNNAVWCDTICRTHRRPGEFLAGLWLNRAETPPFYPNAITLRVDQPERQLAYIKELLAADIPGAWGVKDSFATLDLSSLGFHKVFEGQWIYREAAPAKTETSVVGGRWVRVTDEPALAAWEAAWRDEPADSTQSPIFQPALLTDETIAILAVVAEGRIVAGAIASHTGPVVGLSNLFVPASEAISFRLGCLAAITEIFSGLPLVGYEAGQDLAEMQA
ncbi:MAG: hypothetical protein KDF65_02755, partial [Anaerolineae bacterium]|nr:hypothetical protein [Anaerolineae bacterium]